MKFEIDQIGDSAIAEIISDELIKNTQDALDVIANCAFQGFTDIIIHQTNITPDFFDLKTKIAGDILQKFSNYRCRLAIIGSFENIESKSLRDFIFESNKTGRVIFVGTKEEAIKQFSKK